MGDLIVRQPSNVSGFPFDLKDRISLGASMGQYPVNCPFSFYFWGVSYLGIQPSRKQTIIVRYVFPQQ